MTKRNSSFLLCLLAVLLIHFSCATVKYQEDIADYEDEIQELETRIALDATDSDALRDLGIIYFETGNYDRAEFYLQQAYEKNSDDAKTMFYLAMALEFKGEVEDAVDISQRYTEVSKLSPYRSLMAGRHQRLKRLLIRRQIKTLVERENSLRETRMQGRTVAIFPLQYEGQNPKYSSLGRGISEMMIIDLGNVEELTLLERIRLQTLLDELQLAQGDAVDKASAPRIGLLLGAGRIVAGSFNVQGSDRLSVDVVSWDVIEQDFPDGVDKSDDLDNLFRLEKDLVFGLLDELDIELTPEEVQRIQHIPTQNLQAFLAYSIGLEQEDAGNIAGAAASFNRALSLDPNFSEAAQKAEAAESFSAYGGSPQTIVDQLADIDPPGTPEADGEVDLVKSRLRNLNSSIRANFVPGQDSREGIEDAAESDADFGELAEPPPPPPPNN